MGLRRAPRPAPLPNQDGQIYLPLYGQTLPPCLVAVSYTHLDVYKRQAVGTVVQPLEYETSFIGTAGGSSANVGKSYGTSKTFPN